VFEPIDAYKGDLARTYFYVSTRYYTEDAAWPGSPMTSGADVLPWALDMLLEWHAQDPVSLKEYERNSAVFGLQGNRNPFIDHPGYVELAFGDLTAAPDPPSPAGLVLLAGPNPFRGAATFRLLAPTGGDLSLSVVDVRGGLVATVHGGRVEPGTHTLVWDGRTPEGREAGAGIYFGVVRLGNLSASRRLVRVR
jgi:hypothetical protein